MTGWRCHRRMLAAGAALSLVGACAGGPTGADRGNQPRDDGAAGGSSDIGALGPGDRSSPPSGETAAVPIAPTLAPTSSARAGEVQLPGISSAPGPGATPAATTPAVRSPIPDRRIPQSTSSTSSRPPLGDSNPSTTQRDRRVLTLGLLESNRIAELTIDNLARADAEGLPAVATSPVVGAARQIVRVGKHVLVTATNQPDLVRLDADLQNLRSMSLSSTFPIPGAVRIGGIVAVDQRRVLVASASGSTITIAEIDIETLSVIRSTHLSDRYASYPEACLSPDGRSIVVGADKLDEYDVRTFKRQSTLYNAIPTGLVCTAEGVWMTTLSASDGQLYPYGGGAPLATLSWEGRPATDLVRMRDGRLIVTDAEYSRVLVCPAVGGQCRAVATELNKPNGVAELADGRLAITSEKSRQLVFVSPDLSSVSRLNLPDIPRAPLASIS